MNKPSKDTQFRARLSQISREDDELSFRAHNVLISLRFVAELVEPNMHGYHYAAASRGYYTSWDMQFKPQYESTGEVNSHE